jgi:DNA polymerase-3 subunit delta'
MLTPHENLKLFGHRAAEDRFLNAFHSERFPYGWIIAGSFGIGKATFSYHMARYILSKRKDRNTIFSEKDPLHRRIVAQSHGDLWVLGGEDASEIGVEPVRELNGFLNQTSAEGGWRVVIVDGADRLNHNGANALLKRLEEPPPHTVFFLVTAFPGCLLPTIRSRCQFLNLNPLEEDELQEVLSSQGLSIPDFIDIAQGSPGRLIRLMENEGKVIYEEFQKILKGGSFSSFIHSHGGEEKSYALIEDLLRNFLHTHLVAKAEGRPSCFDNLSIEQVLELSETINNLLDQCRFAQLDKKATLTCIFANLEKSLK